MKRTETTETWGVENTTETWGATETAKMEGGRSPGPGQDRWVRVVSEYCIEVTASLFVRHSYCVFRKHRSETVRELTF